MPERKIFEKIISGGQTGADQGALDAALELNYPCGGWCPKGRESEADLIYGFKSSDLLVKLSDHFRNSAQISYELLKLRARVVVVKMKNHSIGLLRRGGHGSGSKSLPTLISKPNYFYEFQIGGCPTR